MVTKKMLVEQDPHQIRVALLEDDRLAELFVERARHRGVTGNVYKGKVSRVLPGMQAAFVDIGLDRDAFLYVRDIREGMQELDELDVTGEVDRAAARGADEPEPSISDLLRPGQEVLVQVVKDPLASKGARVTTHVTLPGRYLVLAPTATHRGVSRRIEDEEERQRLKDLVAELPVEGGLIVRTAGEGRGPAAFARDAEYLLGLWGRIRERAARAAAPSLVHHDLDAALRSVRDVFDEEVAVIWVDGEDAYTRIVEFLADVQPDLLDRVMLHRQPRPLFERFGIEEAIAEALRPKVWLKSGGYLVITPTEALVAIDVNTGRFVGGKDLAATILQTNLEAVAEIVRQIRLRNLSGILVLDLIDMTDPEHKEQVFAALERELKRDRVKSKVLSISEFGLVEITRKRSRPSLERSLTQPCPYCEGRGRISSISSIVLALRRAVLGHGVSAGHREILVRVHPAVARALQNEERDVVRELEERLEATLVVQADASLHHERFDVLDA